MHRIGEWWDKPAKIYQIWLRRSGFPEGVLLAVTVVFAMHYLI